MGIHRFKLSAMKPNAWFYKLRDMSRNKNQTTQHSHKKNQSSKYSTTTQPSKLKQAHDHPFNARKSYYFTRQLNPKVSNSNNSHDEPPRKKPSKQAPNSRTTMIKKPSPFESSAETEFPEPDEFRTDCLLLTEAFHQTVSMHSKSCTRSRRLDVDKDSNSIARKDVKVIINSYDPSSEFEPPMITIKKKETKPRSRFTVSSNPGVKLRTNKIHTRSRRSVSSPSPSPSAATRPRRRNWDSLAIVKRSRNPERDFRESMVEMIVENKMKAWKDLEDLLASYLYLNSEEYHELIIRVFKQIWSDLRDTTQG